MKHAQDKKINYIQMCTTVISVFLQLYLLPVFFLKLKVCAFYPWSRGGQARRALNKLQYLQIVHTCSALSLYEAIIYTQNTRGMHGQRTAPKTWWLHLLILQNKWRFRTILVKKQPVHRSCAALPFTHDCSPSCLPFSLSHSTFLH